MMTIAIDKFKKPLFISAGTIVCYAILGFFIIPALLKAKLPEIVQQQTAKPASVADVQFNPFSFEMSIQGFELTEADGQKIAALQNLYMNFGIWSSIKHWAIAFDKIYLSQPFIDITIRKDGSLNLADLAATGETDEAEQPQPAEKPFPIWLRQIKIKDGELDIADLSLPEPYRKKITQLDIDVEKLATVTVQKKGKDSLSLHFVNGGGIEWHGDVELAPVVQAEGHVIVKDLNSQILWEYLRQKLGFNINQGTWNLTTDYIFRIEEQQTILAFSKSHLTLTDVLDDGGLLEWRGNVDVLPLINSNGNVQLQQVSLQKLWQHIPEHEKFIVDRGELNLQTDYAFHMTEPVPQQMQLEFSSSKAALTNVFDQGDAILWEGGATVMPALKTEGSLVIKKLNLHPLWQKTQQHVDFKIQQGGLNLQTDYAFQMVDDQPGVTLSKGRLQLNDLALSPKDSEQTLVKVADLSLQDLSFDLQKQQIDIADVATGHAVLLTGINRQGDVNLAEMFTGKAVSEAAEQAAQAIPEAAGKPWLINIGHIALQDYTVDLTRETAGDPVKVKLAPIDITIDNFTNAPHKPFALQAGIGVEKSGKITAQGSIGADPLTVNLDVKATAIALQPLQPFLGQTTKLELVRGDAYLDSNIDLSLADKQKTALKVSGYASVNDLKTVEAKNNKAFLKWRKLDLKKFLFTLEPLKLQIARVDVDGIDTKVIINEDKTTNLGYIFSAPQAPAGGDKKPGPEAAGKAEKPLALKIDTVKINDAAGFFADRSLILPFAADIQQLNGAIKNISTEQQTRSVILLEGKANQTAPLLIEGSVEPFAFEKHLDILLQFHDMNMTGLTPYMAQFAGYKVEKGKLSVDLQYRIENRKLTADNKVVINQLTLGEVVESPDSVSLPVTLAVALLKDADGVIDLDLPLKGDLNDPQFSIFGLLGDVLFNLLSKAVTSPFALVGSLLDADTDLSKVYFAAGRAALDDQQKQVLDTLAEGLLQRPQLQLEIRGIAYRQQDGKGLAELAVMNRIKTIAWQDLDEDDRPANIERTVLSEEDYREILTKLYEKKFGDQAEQLVDMAEDAPDPASAKKYYAQMKQKLVETIPVASHELDHLAMRRADNIAAYITEHAKVPARQVYIVGQALRETAEDNDIVVDLELGAVK